MNTILAVAVIFLILNLAAGLVRVARGPSPEDRMLAALLFASTTVAMLLILAQLMAIPALRDVALLFGLLAAVISVAFVALPLDHDEDIDDEDSWQ